ncbi:hypothetical protein E4634_00140 [Mangrovimicrobium sediminis]|uniref:Uncharacterized protein n=1 Tax=Mangrovimicrobium sediminis TaxID=2562682 RepID=A0A4Z0M9C3_9GAMM|nr:hypothetical protein [Haliea sp. SAOS-164]TGD76000.1 hypothetical protein E4634_00140 [Haliea sp. SAOS-164]
MSEAIALQSAPQAAAGAPWYKSRKLDQWLCFWSVPVFYNLFGLVFVPLSWMMPPRAPMNTEEGVVAFMQSPNLLLASSILILCYGLSAVGNGVYLSQMQRMTVSPVLRYAFIIGAVTGATVGCLFPMFCFGLGAFRPGYDPAILQMLYDFGYLSFIGCLGCFFLNWSCLGLSILLDENNTLPRWLGYYTIWQSVTEIFAMTVWVSHSGPFAWNGLLAFYFNMVLYVPWQITIYVCIYRAIKRQPESQLRNARPVAGAAYA